MNVIKKYWNNVYLYILLLIPTACLIAGVYYTSAKLAGYYPNASWLTVFVFDFSQLTYYLIAFWFILHKKKVMYYSERDITRIKIFITISLFIQYNFIMHTFPSQNAWTCTFIFLGIVMPVRAEQPENALSSIYSKLSGKSIFKRAEQPLKA